MNQGLEILIARTKTHPQEFIGHELYNDTIPKWVLMVQNFTRYATDEEKEAWQEAMTDLNKWHENKRRDDFTEAVMKELLIREGLDDTKDLVAGMIRFNQVLNHHERYDGKKWVNLNQSLTATIVGAGGGGGSSYAGSGGSVVIKTRTGTHTFTKP